MSLELFNKNIVKFIFPKLKRLTSDRILIWDDVDIIQLHIFDSDFKQTIYHIYFSDEAAYQLYNRDISKSYLYRRIYIFPFYKSLIRIYKSGRMFTFNILSQRNQWARYIDNGISLYSAYFNEHINLLLLKLKRNNLSNISEYLNYLNKCIFVAKSNELLFN